MTVTARSVQFFASPTCRAAYCPEAPSCDRRTAAYQTIRGRISKALPLTLGDRVLDVGCGTGLNLQARALHEPYITGFDRERPPS